MLSTRVLGRALAVLAAGGALLFTSATLPHALVFMSVERIGARLMAQQRFTPEALSGVLARAPLEKAARRCDLPVLRAMVVMQGTRLDMAFQEGRLDDIDAPLEQLRAAARAGVGCSPYFAVGWYALALTSFLEQGAGADGARALAMSYRVAPREAWLMLVRNLVALRYFASLDPEARGAALEEWVGLAEGGFQPVAAAGFAVASPAAQGELGARLASIPDQSRNRVRRLVEVMGAGEFLPPLRAEESRPW